ncbi:MULTISPECIES: alkene reductase [Morganellaceae]|uniref:alkene reductase n=1 Tax=Morganellaceae TaxID=1903414 RepID=UPI0018E46422|nr:MULTISPECIES: alkene reductase [Morganellaceae]MBI6530064.1 alkene reductase [Proteus vulgaris]MBP6082211.1 alkene reductase [Providencia sp.]
MSKLFTPYNLSGLELKNRVVMAPMTRTRTMNDVADDVVALYYAQRASAGLLITEGLPVSEEARGYLYTPGIYTNAHVDGWRKVTDAVHEKGGRIFAQLWHVGRMSHVSLLPNQMVPVSSGTVQAINTTVFALTDSGEPGPVIPSAPRALETDEISRVTQDFVSSARLAMDAGFDGVEIMAANGFIFDQFLSSELNTRTDGYGGSVKNRQRFLLETIDAVSSAIGNSKVAVRLSPYGRIYDLAPYEGEDETWNEMAAALGQRELAYVHLYYQPEYTKALTPEGFKAAFRKAFTGTLIAAGGFNRDIAEMALKNNEVDMVAFGVPYIANPDLVERMRNGWPLAESDRSTYYGVSGNPEKGYTDYPFWAAE